MVFDKRSKRPATSIIIKNIAAMRENRQIAIPLLSEDVQNSYGSVQSIVTEKMGMRSVSSKFIPKLLSANQKYTGTSPAQDLFEC